MERDLRAPQTRQCLTRSRGLEAGDVRMLPLLPPPSHPPSLPRRVRKPKKKKKHSHQSLSLRTEKAGTFQCFTGLAKLPNP